MDYFGMFKQLRENFGIGKGTKVAELSDTESAFFENHVKRTRELKDDLRKTELDMREIEILNQKWWLAVRKKYNIETDNITYDDGAIYEIK